MNNKMRFKCEMCTEVTCKTYLQIRFWQFIRDLGWFFDLFFVLAFPLGRLDCSVAVTFCFATNACASFQFLCFASMEFGAHHHAM